MAQEQMLLPLEVELHKLSACLESCIFTENILSVICAVKHILNGLHMLVHSVNEFCLFTNHYKISRGRRVRSWN